MMIRNSPTDVNLSSIFYSMDIILEIVRGKQQICSPLFLGFRVRFWIKKTEFVLLENYCCSRKNPSLLFGWRDSLTYQMSAIIFFSSPSPLSLSLSMQLPGHGSPALAPAAPAQRPARLSQRGPRPPWHGGRRGSASARGPRRHGTRARPAQRRRRRGGQRARPARRRLGPRVRLRYIKRAWGWERCKSYSIWVFATIFPYKLDQVKVVCITTFRFSVKF